MADLFNEEEKDTAQPVLDAITPETQAPAKADEPQEGPQTQTVAGPFGDIELKPGERIIKTGPNQYTLILADGTKGETRKGPTAEEAYNQAMGFIKSRDVLETDTPRGPKQESDVLLWEDTDDPTMVPEEMAERFRAIIKESDNPEETQARLVSAHTISRMMGVEFADAYENLETYIESYMGKNQTPDHFIKAVSESYQAASISTKISSLAYRYMWSNDPTLLKQIEALEAQMPDLETVKRSLPVRALKSVAAFLPAQIESMTWGAATGLATAGAAAATSAGVTAATGGAAALSIPTSALAAFGIGMAGGSTERMRQIETGGMYLDLMRIQDPETGETMDPGLAKLIASTYGSLASLVEMFDVSNLTDSIPGLKNIGKEALQGALKRAASDTAGITVRNTLAKSAVNKITKEATSELGKRLGGVASETLEEIIQEFLAIAGEEIAKNTMNNLEADNPETYFSPATRQEITQRLTDTMVESALGMGLMHGAKGLATTVFKSADTASKTAERAQYQKLERGPEAEVKTVQDLEALKEEASAKLDEGLYIQPRAIAEGEEYILKIGTKEALTAKGEGQRVGYVRYSINQEADAITIEGFEKGTPANAQRALVDHLGRQFPGWEIEWNPTSSRGTALKNIIIENNPRGREGGLQYYTTPTSHVENITTDHIRKRIQEARPGWKKDEVDLSVAFLDSLGKAMGTTGEGLASRVFDSRIFGDEGVSVAAQGGKAALKMYQAPGGAIRALVNLTAESNVSSWMHEATHAAILAAQNVRDTDQGARAFLDELEGIMGVKDGNWHGVSDAFTENYGGERNHHEALTYALEDYFYTGKTARPEMQNLFKRIAQWLADLYRAIKGARVKTNPKLDEFFDRTFNNPESPLYQYATKDQPKPAQEPPKRSAAADLAGVPTAEQREAQQAEAAQRMQEEEAAKLEELRKSVGPKEKKQQEAPADDLEIFQGREEPRQTRPVREEREAVRQATAEDKLFQGEDRPRDAKTLELKNLGDAAMAEIRAQYEGTDQWMKAPNGEATNLTETQWLQVRTPAFKDWFGDWENDPENASKVVDENGEPRVVYRGESTGGNFEQFDVSRTNEKGIFFTLDHEIAADYAAHRDPRSFYINARNPLDLTRDSRHSMKYVNNWGAVYDEWTDRETGEEISPWDYYSTGQLFNYEGTWTGERWKDLQATVNADGYDMAILHDTNGGVLFPAIVVYEPHQIKSATKNVGTFLQDDPSILFQRAWHGTPHRFDQFTTQAMGTGEGAQVYGWGLYFAGDKEVAEWYREKLSGHQEYITFPYSGDDSRYYYHNNLSGVLNETGQGLEDYEQLAATVLWHRNPEGLEKAIKSAEEHDEAVHYNDSEYPLETARQALELAQSDEIEIKTDEGQLYEVEIPDDDEYLDWDKTLDQQSEKVRAALRQIADLGEVYTNAAESMQNFERKNSTGETLYRTLTRDLGTPDRASRDLKAMGIPGIRYLDGNSRGDGKGSYNYVVFADEDVEVINTLYQGEEAITKYPAPIVDLQKRIYALAVEKNTVQKLPQNALTEHRIDEIDQQGRFLTREMEALEDRWEKGDPLVEVETPKARAYQEGDQGTLFQAQRDTSYEDWKKLTPEEQWAEHDRLLTLTEELREESMTSGPTGLPNYKAYAVNVMDDGKREIQGSLDADSLKWINDTVGHDAGDEMLQKIGLAMKHATKGLDVLIYHKSGDEFLIQANNADDARLFYKRVDILLEQAEIIRVDQETGHTIEVHGIGLSIGLSDKGDMDAADRALGAHKKYREDHGKRAGRGLAPIRVDIRSNEGRLLTREEVQQYAEERERAAAQKRTGAIDDQFSPEAMERDLAKIDDRLATMYQGRDIRAVAFQFPKELKAYSDIHSASQLGGVLNTFGRGVLDASTGEIRLGAIGSSHAGMTAGMKDPRRFYYGISRAKEAVYIVAKNGMDEDRFKSRDFLMPALSQIFDQYKLQVAQGQRLAFHDTLYQGEVQESDFHPTALDKKRLELQYGFTETLGRPIDFGPTGPVLRAIGLPEGRITMSSKKLATSKQPETYKDQKGYHGHGTTLEDTLAVQAKLLDPEAVYLHPNNQNEFIVMTGDTDSQGRPVLVYLSAPREEDRKAGNNNTVIKSFYGRNNYQNYSKALEGRQIYNKGPTTGDDHKRSSISSGALIERILTREAVVNGETENYLTESYNPDQGTYLYMGMDQLRGEDDPSLRAIKEHARTCESWEQLAEDFDNPLFDLPNAPDLPEAEKRRWYREVWEAANHAAETDGDVQGWLASLEENDHAKLKAFLKGIWEEVISGETHNIMPSDQDEMDEVKRKRDLADRVQSEIAESVKAGALRVGAKGKELSERYTATIMGTIRANPEAYAQIYGEIFEIPELAQVAAAQAEQKYANIEDPILKTRRLSISQKTALVKAIQNEELGRKIMTGNIASDEVKEYIKYVRGEVKKGQERIKELESEINDDRQIMTAHEKRWTEASKTLADLEREIVKHHQRINAILKEGKGIPPALAAEENRLARYKATLERQRDRAASKIDEPAKYAVKLAKIEEAARIKASVQARLIEQKAIKKAKEYQDSLVKAIMKKAGSTVNLEQARAIKAIQDSLDPHNRLESTQEKIDALRAELEANPALAKELPREWVNRAAKRNLGEITLAELEEMAQAVKNLRRQGRQEYDAKKAARDAEARTWQDNLLDTILHLPHAAKPGEAPDDGIVAKFMQKVKAADYAFTRPQQFIELLDGKTNGPLYELLVKERDRHYREELAARHRRIENLEKAFKDEGVKMESWYDTTVTLKGLGPSNTDITLTKSDMAAIDMAFRNEQSRAAALYGNFFSHVERKQMTDDDLFLEGGRKFTAIRDAIDDTLTEADFRIIERIAADGDDTGARLVDVVGRVENRALETVDNYFPIKRLGVVGEAIDKQIAGDITSRLGGLKKPPRNGFTKSRVDISPRTQTAIRLDLYNTWIRSIKEQEHYLSTAEYGKKLDAILTNNIMQEAVKAAAGDAGVKYLKDYVAEIKNPGELRNLQKWEESVRWLRGNLGVGYLAMKSSSVLKQLITSPWPALAYSGPHFFGNLFKALANPVGFLREQENTSAILKSRNMDPIMDAVKNAEAKTKAARGLKKVNEIGMKGLELVDRYCVAIGWRAMYDKARAEGLDVSQAIEKADDLTIKTQPTSREVDLSPVYRDQSGPMAILLQFTSQLNVIWNNVRRDIPMAIREREFGRAVGIITGYVIAGVLMNLMTDGLGGDDDEPDAKDIAGRLALYSTSQFIEAMPFIGGYVTEALRPLLTDEKGYNFPDTTLPGVDLFFEGITTIANNPDNWARGLGQFSQGLGLMTGAPVSGIKEAARVASGDFGALFGRRKKKE